MVNQSRMPRVKIRLSPALSRHRPTCIVNGGPSAFPRARNYPSSLHPRSNSQPFPHPIWSVVRGQSISASHGISTRAVSRDHPFSNIRRPRLASINPRVHGTCTSTDDGRQCDCDLPLYINLHSVHTTCD